MGGSKIILLFTLFLFSCSSKIDEPAKHIPEDRCHIDCLSRSDESGDDGFSDRELCNAMCDGQQLAKDLSEIKDLPEINTENK